MRAEMKRIRQSSIGAVASLMVLTACETPAYDPNDPNRNMRQGAIGGAVAGALAGAALGEGSRAGEMAVGALIGGAVGGAVGNSLDKQAAELASNLGNGIEVINNGNELIVRMPQDILFDVDSAAVRPGLQSDLYTLADSLQRYPDSTVVVVGHTDNTGSATYNQELSERRANSVVSAVGTAGVDSVRLRGFGAGEDQPIGSNLTPEGRQQNRRVDITIRPS